MADAEQNYEAVLVHDAESQRLGVPVDSPALRIERVTFDAGERSFEYVQSIDRGYRYLITTRLGS